MKPGNRARREQLGIYGPLLLVILAAFAVAFGYMEPAPPRKITIASGEPGGAYAEFAKRYQRLLQKQGLVLEIRHTQGTMENLELLRSGKVDVAFVQGGVELGEAGTAGLEGLGSLYFEPLWLFYRDGVEVKDGIPSLKGLRMSLGPDGSGTQALVRRLLVGNGIPLHGPNLQTLSSDEAAEKLVEGTLDAAFFVASLESRRIRDLLHSTRVHLASFRRAEAYARRYPYITRVVLPEGAEDLANNVPPYDVELLAVTSSLVVRRGIHPALVGLLMQVMEEVHSRRGWFEKRGAFPTPDYMAFPLNEQAQHYYKQGPPFLQRYLPFWAASFLDRIKIMILPLLGLMVPMFKLAPPLYRWRMRSRIYRWYDQLEEVDTRAANDPEADLLQLKKELDEMEREVRDIKVPLSFSDQLYHLRLHIDFVSRRLERLLAARESVASR